MKKPWEYEDWRWWASAFFFGLAGFAFLFAAVSLAYEVLT